MKEIEIGIFEASKDENIFVIGDIHGDYQCLIHCMVDLAKTCDIIGIEENEMNKNKEILGWKENNNSVVIFCGDLIHRKRFDHVLDDECSDVYILLSLLRLKKEAKSFGGDIILIAGNHEIMNLLNPNDTNYTSDLNIKMNKEFFTNENCIREYVKNSYAWIKLNDILLSHGGLCSDYLTYLENVDLKNENIISYINKKYRDYFYTQDYLKLNPNDTNYNLFVKLDENASKHNIFWCRMWGYGVDCNVFEKTISKVDCKKMIVAHCPQFLHKAEPRMISFECKDTTEYESYKLARIDLGMSRCFDYNKSDKFFYYLDNNYNRKITILKLLHINGDLVMNKNSIVTKKLSCIQYLLLKYGISKDEWKNYNIDTNWYGFESINFDKHDCEQNKIDVIKCLLYPIYCENNGNVESIIQYKKFIKL